MGASESVLVFRRAVLSLGEKKGDEDVMGIVDELFRVPVTHAPVDVSALMTLADGRAIVANMGVLSKVVRHGLAVMERVLRDEQVERFTANNAVLSVRVLTRLIPLIYESGSEAVFDGIGDRLLRTLVSLLFRWGFCTDEDGGWKRVSPMREYALIRSDCLRLLLVMQSHVMYNRQDFFPLSKLDDDVRKSLLQSLLNCLALPPSTPFYSSNNPLITTATQYLLVSLTSFSDLLAQMTLDESQCVTTDISNLLNSSSSSLLTAMNIQHELICLLFSLFHASSQFLKMTHNAYISTLHAIVHLSLTVKQDASKAGHLRLACFTLHLLSQERSFATALNSPFNPSSIASLSKHFPILSNGTYSDFLVLAIYSILSTTGPLRHVILSLQEPYLVTLANVSPLVKSLSATTSNKLINLFDIFSSPAFLLSKENNFRLLYYLLDIFNNIIQYQFQGNPQLIYAIVRHRERILALYNISLPTAIENVTKLRRKSSMVSSSESLEELSTLQIKEEQESPKQESSKEETPKETTSEKLEKIPSPKEISKESSSGKEYASNPSDQQKDQQKDLQKNLSEKALGKLPASPPSSSPRQSTTSAEAFKSKSGFVPTQEWFNRWRPNLPLLVVLTLANHLGPIIEQFCVENGITDDRRLIEFVSKETMVGVLPQPHPIVIRRFIYSDSMKQWFVSYVWGTIYVRDTEQYTDSETAKICTPVFVGTNIKMFQVKINKSSS